MEAIRELKREHEAILGLLERFARNIDEGELEGQVDAELTARVLDFMEREVDGHHQEKEERALLRGILERACDADSRCARQTFREHDDERRLLTLLRGNLEGAAYGEPTCVAAVVRYARRYVDAQRAHIVWEEDVLFALAQRILGPDDERRVMQGFREVDERWDSSVCDSAARLRAWLDQRASLVPA